MIQSWKSKEAREVFQGFTPAKGFPTDLVRMTRRRLAQLDAATQVEDLRSPPSNRLHIVEGRWSISVNRQFRITFLWGQNGPEEVWFGDYH